MRYKIFGDEFPAVTIQFEAGESVYTQSGGMSWMTNNFDMQTNMRGGLMKGLGRMLSGESLFMATFTAQAPGAELTLASSFPGTILPLEMNGSMQYIAQKSAFLCATHGVELSAQVNKLGTGLFGGEGFVMQRFSGTGIVFVEVFGTMVERYLQPGETLKVDTGNLAMFESTVTYDITTVKGFANALFGGEGLFLSTVTGPGKVWLQTMSASSFASQIIPFMPAKG